MKPVAKGIAAGLIVAAFAFFAIRALPSSVDKPPIECSETSEKNKGESCNKSLALIAADYIQLFGSVFHRYRDDINAASTIFIATFTIILGIYTVQLAKTSRRALDIAEQSARNYERPWVFLDGTSIRIRGGLDPSNPNFWFLKLHFKNIGRSPAIIQSCEACIEEKSKLGPNPNYSIVSFDLALPRTVAVGEIVESTEAGPGVRIPAILVFFGVLKYQGLSGQNYQTGFAMEMSPHIPGAINFGGDAYNFYT